MFTYNLKICEQLKSTSDKGKSNTHTANIFNRSTEYQQKYKPDSLHVYIVNHVFTVNHVNIVNMNYHGGNFCVTPLWDDICLGIFEGLRIRMEFLSTVSYGLKGWTGVICFPDGGLAFVTTQTTMMIVIHMSRSDPPINPNISSKFIVSPSKLKKNNLVESSTNLNRQIYNLFKRYMIVLLHVYDNIIIWFCVWHFKVITI